MIEQVKSEVGFKLRVPFNKGKGNMCMNMHPLD